MVKHGQIVARDLVANAVFDPNAEGRFQTTIQRNCGHEFDLPLLSSSNALATFDLLTRDVYTPWGKPDEISFHVTVVCKHCGQKADYRHGRTGFCNGTDEEEFKCLCGQCHVQLVFQFSPNSVFNVFDWVPVVGPAMRTGAAFASEAVGRHDVAQTHWEQAADHLIPKALVKRKFLTKDGALAKVAELMPGSNIIAALLHEYHGNREEVYRALDLFRSWQDVMGPDGALAKLAEFFPGTDVVAFAVHLNAGNCAQALRAVTKSESVTIKIEMASLTVLCSPASALACQDFRLAGLQVGPSQRFITGAVIDLVEDLLNIRREDGGSTRIASDDSMPPSLSNQVEAVTNTVVVQLSEVLKQSVLGIEEQIPRRIRKALAAANAEIATLRQASFLARFFLPDLPYPSNAVLVESVKASIRTATLTHYDVLPTVEPVSVRTGMAVPPRGIGGHALRRPGVIIFLYFTAFLSFLRLIGLPQFEVALFFVAAVGAWYCSRERLNDISKFVASRLTTLNASTWSQVCCPGKQHALGNAVGLGIRLGLGVGNIVPACPVLPSGIIIDLEPDVVAAVSTLARQYVLADALRSLGLVLMLLEPLFRAVLQCVVPGVVSVPLVIPFKIEEQIINGDTVPGWPFVGKALSIPSLQLALRIDLGLRMSGPYVVRARAMVSDSQVNKVVRGLAADMSTLDLRCCDPRMSGFLEEVRCSFSLGLRWPTPDQVRIEAVDIRTVLRLPN